MRLATLLLMALAAGPAAADRAGTGRLAEMAPQAPEATLGTLAMARAVAAHCPGYRIEAEDYARLAEAADRLARDALGLSPDEHEARFLDPALAALDRPKTCDAVGPKVAGLVSRLTAGGAVASLASRQGGG
jgi:hypothetical protein